MSTKDQYLALSAAVQNKLPDIFINQIRAGYSIFEVTHDLLSPRACQLVLQNPKRSTDPETGEEYVSAKIQLNMILETGVNPDNNEISIKMIPLGPNKSKAPNQAWAKGFYSELLRFDKALVQAGFITADEQKFLFDYVSLWEANGDNNYTAGSDAAKQRVYLRTKNSSAVFQFNAVERPDKEGQLVIGMSQVGWTPGGLELFGTGVQGVPVKIQAAVESFAKGTAPISISRPVGNVSAVTPVAGARSI